MATSDQNKKEQTSRLLCFFASKPNQRRILCLRPNIKAIDRKVLRERDWYVLPYVCIIFNVDITFRVLRRWLAYLFLNSIYFYIAESDFHSKPFFMS